MRTDYQVVDSSSKLPSRELAEFLSKEGQLLLPMLDLLTQGQRAIDERAHQRAISAEQHQRDQRERDAE